MASPESFGQFITRILEEKNLSLSDVERRTNKAISDSYLSYIIQDKGVVNLTLRKVKALAQGLGVREAVILEAASGVPLVEATNAQDNEFARVMKGYDRLSDQDKLELSQLLQILSREIDRRLSGDNGEQRHE